MPSSCAIRSSRAGCRLNRPCSEASSTCTTPRLPGPHRSLPPSSIAAPSSSRRSSYGGASFRPPLSGRPPISLPPAFLDGNAVFDNAELADQSRFTGANFSSPASFFGVHFGGGAGLLTRELLGRCAVQPEHRSRRPGLPECLHREHSPIFRYVLYSGTTDFSGAQFTSCRGADHAAREPGFHRLRRHLPQPAAGGTPGPVSWYAAQARRPARDRLESHRSDRPPERGDCMEPSGRLHGAPTTSAAANEAAVLRLGLERHSMPVVVRQLDWAFAWGVGGIPRSAVAPGRRAAGALRHRRSRPCHRSAPSATRGQGRLRGPRRRR